MGMEPFDYLTYKRRKLEEGENAQPSGKRIYTQREKNLALGCIVTFVCFFIFAMFYVASKSSKIDIEYGRLGKNSNKTIEFKDEINGEEVTRKEKITVDKRLFLIQQEEKGPSESKIIGKNNEAEVISNSEFNDIKNKNEEFLNNKTQEEEPVIKTETIKEPVTTGKIVMKPKLPVATVLPEGNTKVVVKPVGAIETPVVVTKVFVGKYSTIEEAKQAQSEMSDTPSFVKKINGFYTLQVGSFDNYDVAKATASKLKGKGHSAWLYQ